MCTVPTGLPRPSSHSLPLKHPHPLPPPGPSPPSHSHDNSSILLLQKGAEPPSGALVPLWLQQKPPARGAKGGASKGTQYEPELIFLGALENARSRGHPWNGDSGIRLRPGYAAPSPEPQLPTQIVPSSPPVPSPGRGSERWPALPSSAPELLRAGLSPGSLELGHPQSSQGPRSRAGAGRLPTARPPTATLLLRRHEDTSRSLQSTTSPGPRYRGRSGVTPAQVPCAPGLGTRGRARSGDNCLPGAPSR